MGDKIIGIATKDSKLDKKTGMYEAEVVISNFGEAAKII